MHCKLSGSGCHLDHKCIKTDRQIEICKACGKDSLTLTFQHVLLSAYWVPSEAPGLITKTFRPAPSHVRSLLLVVCPRLLVHSGRVTKSCWQRKLESPAMLTAACFLSRTNLEQISLRQRARTMHMWQSRRLVGLSPLQQTKASQRQPPRPSAPEPGLHHSHSSSSRLQHSLHSMQRRRSSQLSPHDSSRAGMQQIPHPPKSSEHPLQPRQLHRVSSRPIMLHQGPLHRMPAFQSQPPSLTRLFPQRMNLIALPSPLCSSRSRVGMLLQLPKVG